MRKNKSLKNFIQYDYKKLREKHIDIERINYHLIPVLNHKLKLVNHYVKPLDQLNFPDDWLITYNNQIPSKYGKDLWAEIGIFSTKQEMSMYEHISPKYFNNLGYHIDFIEYIGNEYYLKYDPEISKILIFFDVPQQEKSFFHRIQKILNQNMPNYKEFNFFQYGVYFLYKQLVLDMDKNDMIYKHSSVILNYLEHSEWVDQLCEKLQIQK